MGIAYAQKVFKEIRERSVAKLLTPEQAASTIGLCTSTNDFMNLVIQANDAYNKSFGIADDKKLIFAEDFPKELVGKLNNDAPNLDVTSGTLRDIRLVTYTVNEQPAIISSHTINGDGIRNIKWKFESVYEDPKYTGYSILRSIKEIQVDITFKVWGNYLQDIRERSKMLKDIIDLNTCIFLDKGLRTIVWMGSVEEEVWDGKNLAKFKSEKYQLRIAEVKELRQKNLEQVIIQMGLGE